MRAAARITVMALLVAACRPAEPTVPPELLEVGAAGEVGPSTPRAGFVVYGVPAAQLEAPLQRVVSGSDEADDGSSAEGSVAAGVRIEVMRDVAAGSTVLQEATASPRTVTLGLRIPDGTPVRRVADEIAAVVHDAIRQERVYRRQTPDETLRTGRGDCTEIADLTATVLRDLGVDARVVGGVAPHEGRLRWHAWVEYYDGRWATIDPTLDQHPADAGHIRMAVSEEGARLEALEGLIGRVRVEPAAAPVNPSAPAGGP